MIKHLFIALILLFLATAAAAEQIRLTFAQAYQRALEQSEKLQITKAEVQIAEAQYKEALSAVFPQLSLTASERVRNEETSTTSFNEGTGFSGGGFSGNRNDRFLVGASVTQPIFHGFRDFYLFYAGAAETQSRRFSSDRFRELLYLDVAEAFYQLRLYEQELGVLRQSTKSVADRIAELKDFEALGKSRPSEVEAAETELFGATALEAQTIGLLTASREVLAFLCGIPAESIAAAEDPTLPPTEPLDHYVGRAQARLDIRASDESVKSSEYQLTAAERERWPAIDLEGNYYGHETPDTGREWDVLVRAQIPIFDGGRISSRIEQQRAELRANELRRQELAREAERDVRTAFGKLQSGTQEIEALEAEVSAAERNYQSQRKDYELGVVNNVDVLISIRRLYDARRKLIRAQTNVTIERVRLDVAAGGVGG